MANTKISALSADTAPTADDLVVTVNDPAGTPATKKATITNFTKAIPAVVGDSGSGGTKGLVPAPAAGDAAAGKFLKADGTFAVPAGAGGGGTFEDFDEGAAPATPASNKVRLYAKADGLLYSKDDAGAESAVSGGGGSGITTLNALTADPQTFATGASGTGFNISSSGSTHTFNIPIASAAAAGLVNNNSGGSQAFAGSKIFTEDVIVDNDIRWRAGTAGGNLTYQSVSNRRFNIAKNVGIMWSDTDDTATGGSAIDVGVIRNAAGVLEVNSGTLNAYRDLKVRQHYVDQTITAGGTTGAQTINKSAGTVNIAAAGTSVVVTCDKCTTSSLVFAVIRTNDSTATIKNVVPASGSFTINLTAAATAEVSIGFLVVNQ